MQSKYDAVVVGSGPNGLAAGIKLLQAGMSVLLLEGKDDIGGGMRSAALTMPGFVHDVCSAIHPMAVLSPFFKSLPLSEHGLQLIQPKYAAAHPLDHGHVATLERSVELTADGLGVDRNAYLDLMVPVLKDLPALLPDLLGPLSFPKHPLAMARFGLKALPSAQRLSRSFETREAKALWAGMAAHSMQPLSNMTTSAIGIVLMAGAHLAGWPVPKGGSQSIANALVSYFKGLGGDVVTGFQVRSLDQLPAAKAVLLDVTPRQLIDIAGEKLTGAYVKRLKKYRYGMGVFKIDWALNGPIPFTAEKTRQAGTVHLGNSCDEISASEHAAAHGKHADRPFVLLAQPSIFDSTRAPEGKHTAWAYCHVPNGSRRDMTDAIEKQVERFAPGFRDLILKRHTMDTSDMENYNPNYVGGDINGGVQDIFQLYTRPVLSISPYRTSAKGIYICSSSTPPGGGVHGMCGYHAANQALKDVFGIG